MQPEPLSYETAWQTALGELEVSVSKPTFETWFRHTFIFSIDGATATIGVPNNFVLDWLAKKHRGQILDVLRKLLPDHQIKEVAFKVAVPKQAPQQAITLQPLATTPATADAAPAATVPERPRDSSVWELNPHYTFENFIVGTHNRLAHAAALAIASEPGRRHNPFFIYGGVGLGKTHLIQAIGNEIKRADPKKRILYSSCEKFGNEFIAAIQTRRMEAFKEKYRNVDVLLIDDIQFLAGKEGTQEEFFHTFNALHQTNRQIILTSDRMPQAIPELEDRLSSRFVWGMVTDIKTPDVETRAAILRQKCLDRKKPLDNETVELIARTHQSNIRELEGALNQILAYCELEKVEPTFAVVEQMLKDRQPSRRTGLSAEQIYDIVSKHYHTPIQDLFGTRRHKELVHPRQIIMYLLRHELNFSFPKIGRELGKDHTTIMHGVEKIEYELPKNPILQQEISLLKDQLYSAN